MGVIKCPKCGEKNPDNNKFCSSCGEPIVKASNASAKVIDATRVTEKTKKKTGFWASIIPGYHGYKEKEMRRETDKLLRGYLVNWLKNMKNELTTIEEDVATNSPGSLKKVETFRTELDTYSRKIQHADYGYGELFGVKKVKEADLDKLLDFDRTIIETIQGIDDNLKKFGQDVVVNTEGQIKDLRAGVKKAIEVYNQRDEFLAGFTVDE